MAETPIQELRALLDGSLRLLADDAMPSGLLVHALDILAAVESDAAVGAAVRECDERGLRYQRVVYDDGTTMDIQIWQPCRQAGPPSGHGTTFPAALADWKHKNGVEG